MLQVAKSVPQVLKGYRICRRLYTKYRTVEGLNFTSQILQLSKTHLSEVEGGGETTGPNQEDRNFLFKLGEWVMEHVFIGM